MSAMLCKKSTRNALRCVMILHSCLALGQTPPTTHQPQPTIHTKLSFCWCNHNWWKHSGSQNLHVRSWLQLHCAWKNHEEALPVSTFSYFSIGNLLLVVGSFTKMHGWFQQWSIRNSICLLHEGCGSDFPWFGDLLQIDLAHPEDILSWTILHWGLIHQYSLWFIHF